MKSTMIVIAGVLLGANALAQRNAESGLFTELETGLMDVVWDEIRNEPDFSRIDWEELGLAGPPGNWQAERLMDENWDELRRANRFTDIDWSRHTRDGDRRASRERGGFDWLDSDRTEGPFTDREAEMMSRVWPEIREARSFEQIDWDAVGLNGAPGDLDARRIMSDYWDNLRVAENFEDINWEASTNIRESRLE